MFCIIRFLFIKEVPLCHWFYIFLSGFVYRREAWYSHSSPQNIHPARSDSLARTCTRRHRNQHFLWPDRIKGLPISVLLSAGRTSLPSRKYNRSFADVPASIPNPVPFSHKISVHLIKGLHKGLCTLTVVDFFLIDVEQSSPYILPPQYGVTYDIRTYSAFPVTRNGMQTRESCGLGR